MSPAARRCADAVEGYFGTLADQLLDQRGAMAAALAAPGVDSDAVIRAARPLAQQVLTRPQVHGAGFVVAPDALGGEALLAWWQGDGRTRGGEPLGRVDSGDYTRLEWYRVPAATGRPHVTGPYIDFVCTDEYVMTLTVPVTVAGVVVGVLGADTLVTTLERVLTGVFRGSAATLVNEHGRVVLSDEPRVFPGERVSRERFAAELPCGDLPLAVLVAA